MFSEYSTLMIFTLILPTFVFGSQIHGKSNDHGTKNVRDIEDITANMNFTDLCQTMSLCEQEFEMGMAFKYENFETIQIQDFAFIKQADLKVSEQINS